MSYDQDTLIGKLQSAAAYPHATDRIRLVETHISWVLLTGELAYKVKKAVSLPFLDFSTLELRKRYCDDELRLNRRLAPEIYLDVVAIGGTDSAPRVGDTPAIEYAVQMHQFPPADTGDELIARDALDRTALRRLADRLATFHSALEPQAGPDGDGGVAENLRELEAMLQAESAPALAETGRRLRAELARLRPIRKEREREGRIRECHGDLHLGNIVRIGDDLVPFDCLEFDQALRTIDLIDEIAFLYMDLAAHGRRDLAFEFVNGYLERTGDYGGLCLLRYYAAHRALVRAKVAAIAARQTGGGAADSRTARYLRAASDEMQPAGSVLLITCGLSGSGKSTLARRLARRIGAVHVRSDIERKRLHGLAPQDRPDAAIGGGLYSPAASDATYDRLHEVAESALRGRLPVIVDAAFLSAARRADFLRLAAQRATPCLILECRAAEATLRERIRRRAAASSDPSDADEAVLDHQLASFEPIACSESAHTLRVDTEADLDAGELAAAIAERAQVSLSSTSY